MTDKIDEMFASDLSKLSMPSELAMNAAKVKAAQTDKPGAEKPDLYAKGKGVGKDGKPAKDEENDERKSKGPNKGKKKDPNAPDKQQGAKSKDDMDKEAEDERAFTATRYYKRRFLLPGMKETRRTIAIRGKIPKGQSVPTPHAEKKASIDDEFNADMRQIVGAEAEHAQPDFDRPDVSVEGQTTDRIDDHFLSWMQDKADEDVVKEAISIEDAHRLASKGTADEIMAAGKKAGRKGAVKGALGAAGLIAAGVGAKKLMDKKKDGEKKAELDKEAGVQQNPENLDLLARIRKSAEQKYGDGLVAGSGDV
jgi:hypothetical protein